jgi:UDP-N-acetyl-D-mannosaminouronate:lipid I N-acetyl-D-mannosaminouronosyltransferase
MKSASINGYIVNAPESKAHLLDEIKNYKGILVAMNAEKILKKDKALNDLINENLGYPDGIGAVWALKQKGLITTKIAGAEFWLDIINKFQNNKSFYFVGASEEVITQTVEKLKTKFPEINIKGFRNGFIKTGEEKNNLIKDVSQKKPDVVFVAMGTPKQEFLMDEMFHQHKALYMGLGGSFDVFTGRKKRAPIFYQKLGLEWFHRLLKEPTRIKRQVVYLKFMWLLMLRQL